MAAARRRVAITLGDPGLVASCTSIAADDAYLMRCFDETRIAHVLRRLVGAAQRQAA